jgi:hypothetical protein
LEACIVILIGHIVIANWQAFSGQVNQSCSITCECGACLQQDGPTQTCDRRKRNPSQLGQGEIAAAGKGTNQAGEDCGAEEPTES